MDMSVLLVVLVVTGIVLYGWGILAWRCLGISSPNNLSSLTMLLGFCVVLSMSEFVHIFVPITWRVTVTMIVVGLIGFKYQIRSLEHSVLQKLHATIKQYPWQMLIVTVMIVLWCLRAMGVPNNYDSGLYHFQSIRWLNEEPIVLGIGNLHWRLALNQAYFGYLALLNFAPYWNKGYAAGGIFLLLLTLLTLFQIAKKQSVQWKCSIGLVLFLSLGFVAASIVNPSPDNAVTLLEIVIFIFLLNMTQDNVKDGEDNPNFIHFALLTSFLCVAVVLIKFSSVGFAIGSFLFLGILIIRRKALARKIILRAIIVLVIFISVHLLRGYILSGAPLFPSTIFGAWDLFWAVPKHVAIAETEMIFRWARRPGLEFVNQVGVVEGWFIAWLNGLSPLIKWMFTTSTLLMLINGVRLLTARESNSSFSEYLLFLPVLSGLSFWFLTAPDVRFLGAVLFLFFALSVYLTLKSQTKNTAIGLKVQRILSTRIVQLFIFIIVVLISLRYLGMNSLSFTGWSVVPQAKTEIRTTKSAQEIRVPVFGNQCWNSTLPCASIFNDTLRFENLRGHTIFSVKPQ